MKEKSSEKNNKTLIWIITGIILLVIVVLLLLKACSVKEYTVTFDTNGGSKIEEVTVKENEKVKKPNDPVKDGYVFDGWYLDDKLYDFNSKVTKDITLEAYWKSKGIELSSTNISLEVGDLHKLDILSMPDGIDESDLVYTSSDEDIVTVDENGNLKALKTGTVTITVKTKDGKYIAKCTVTVNSNDTEELTIEGDSSVVVGSSIKLTVNTDQKITWKSSDTSIATVDENGNVKGIKAGTVTITVTTEDGQTATKKITVKSKSNTQNNKPNVEVTGINISGQKEMFVGESINLSASVTPNNATNKKVTWKSSNPGVATVDQNGKVTGVSSGTVTITVTASNGKTATYDVTVKDSYVIYLTKRELAVVGGGIQYDFRVEKNGGNFTDYLGFTYNGTKVSKNQGSVASTVVEKGGNSATLKLSNKQEVTASVVVK